MRNRTIDFGFYRNLVIINGLVPAILLLWDAWRGQLGANAVNNAIHITGILSLVFLFLSLAITPLRVLTNWNSLIAYRRALGLYGFMYAVIHFAIYIAWDRMGSLTSTWDEITSRRYLMVGFAALSLMLPLAVTSTNAMIRKLGPSRWKLLHRAAYFAAALGVLHYYMLVKSDVRQPLAFAAVLTPMLGFRAVKHYVDLRRAASVLASRGAAQVRSQSRVRSSFWQGSLVVAYIHQETHDVRSFRFVPEDKNELPFEHLPGQYLNLSLTIDGQQVRRSYTIASSPTQRGFVEITVKRDPSGIASRYLHDVVKVGDRIRVGAPAGKFYFDGKTEAQVLLVAGGVGVTPVMAILRYLTDHSWTGRIDFVYVIKSANDCVFEGELRSIVERFSNVHLHLFLTRQPEEYREAALNSRWRVTKGYPTRAILEEIVRQPASTPTFLCGPEAMMRGMEIVLVDAGFSKDSIFTEAFTSSPNRSTSASEPLGKDPLGPQTGLAVSSTVVFRSSKREVEIDAEQSILDAAESAGVQLSWECRSGICGQCKVKCTEGSVRMEVSDALSRRERDAGYILACQSHALQPRIVVEA